MLCKFNAMCKTSWQWNRERAGEEAEQRRRRGIERNGQRLWSWLQMAWRVKRGTNEEKNKRVRDGNHWAPPPSPSPHMLSTPGLCCKWIHTVGDISVQQGHHIDVVRDASATLCIDRVKLKLSIGAFWWTFECFSFWSPSDIRVAFSLQLIHCKKLNECVFQNYYVSINASHYNWFEL